MKYLKNIAVNGCLFFLVGFIGVVTLEYCTRWALPQYDPRGGLVFLSDKKYQVNLGPKMVHQRHFKNTGDFDLYVDFNKYGLRDKKDIARSTEQDYFAVGDSISFGWGVEEDERYSNLLQAKMGKNVYNISVPADFGGYEALIRYAIAHGARVKKLIVGVTMENDLKDYEDVAYLSPDQKQLLDLRRWLSIVKVYLTRKSAAYTAISTAVHHNQLLKQTAIKAGLLVENLAGMGKNTLSEPIIASSVRKLVELSSPYETTILIIPSRGLWVGENMDIERAVHDRFVAGLKQAGLDIVDMRPIFEQTRNPLQFNFKEDGHWNPAGHRKAAEVLATHIVSKIERRRLKNLSQLREAGGERGI